MRAALGAHRRALAPAQAASAAAALARLLIEQAALPAGAAVSGYWPLAGELDPRPAMLALAERGHPLCLPRLQGSSQPLRFHAWQPGQALVPGRFNLLEPAAEWPALTPQVLLVPLLAFDNRCRRLGWGKGFYDRTLAELRAADPATLAIGVAFAAQEVDAVPVAAYDQRLDAVVTEIGLYRYRRP